MTRLKIGDFAKLAQISTHRLRNYEKLGLLSPHHIDAQSGYRYYAVEQLGRVNRIIALRGLGLSLAEIKAALMTNIDIDEIEGMLSQRQIEIEAEISARQYQLQQVHHRLQQIKNEARVSPYEIVVKPLPTYTIASIRMIVNSHSEVSFYCNALHHEIHMALAELDVHPKTPTINLYHMAAYSDPIIDLEACVVVPDEALGKITDSRVQIRTLNGHAHAATLLFAADYSEFGMAVSYMEQWAKREGYHPTGAFREVHHAHMVNKVKNQTGKPVVELQAPIEKIAP